MRACVRACVCVCALRLRKRNTILKECTLQTLGHTLDLKAKLTHDHRLRLKKNISCYGGAGEVARGLERGINASEYCSV